MPRRRLPSIPPAPAVPTAPAPRPRSRYQVANQIPQRGWPDAEVWLDTGVLLFIGTDAALAGQVRGHFGRRARVTRGIDREVRGHSKRQPSPEAPDRDHDRFRAAGVAVREFLLGGQGVPVRELSESDLQQIEPLKLRLAALSAEPGKKHGGEAELILMARRSLQQAGRRQILLTNDGGASVVADQEGVPARHAGDVLAELCCDGSPDAASCWTAFQHGQPVSGVPAHCRPRGPEAFTCRGSADGCRSCEAVEGSGEVSQPPS